jgi:hypothetical protein
MGHHNLQGVRDGAMEISTLMGSPEFSVRSS